MKTIQTNDIVFYSVCRSSIGIMRLLKELKATDVGASDELERDEFLQRSLSLVLQTMALNVLSLVVCFAQQLVNWLGPICGFGKFPCPNFGYIYVFYMQPLNGLTCINSNLGFFMHSYYSRLYRESARHFFQTTKNKLMSVCCCFSKHIRSNRQVSPAQANETS